MTNINPWYIIYFIIFCLAIWLIVWLITKKTHKKTHKKSRKSYRASKDSSVYFFEPPPTPAEIFDTYDEDIIKVYIHNIINKFSPIYMFHPDERYYPAPLDTFAKCTGIFNNSTSTSINDKQINNINELLLLGETEFSKRYRIVTLNESNGIVNRLLATKNNNYFISIIQNPNVDISAYNTVNPPLTIEIKYTLDKSNLFNYGYLIKRYVDGVEDKLVTGFGLGFVLYNNKIYSKNKILTNTTTSPPTTTMKSPTTTTKSPNTTITTPNTTTPSEPQWFYYTYKWNQLYSEIDSELINTLNQLTLSDTMANNDTNIEINYTLDTTTLLSYGYNTKKYIDGIDQNLIGKQGMGFVTYNNILYEINKSNIWYNTTDWSTVSDTNLISKLNTELDKKYNATKIDTIRYFLNPFSQDTNGNYRLFKYINNIPQPETAVGKYLVLRGNILYIKQNNGDWWSYTILNTDTSTTNPSWTKLTNAGTLNSEPQNFTITKDYEIKFTLNRSSFSTSGYNIIKYFNGVDQNLTGKQGVFLISYNNIVYVINTNRTWYNTNNWTVITDQILLNILNAKLDRLLTTTQYEPINEFKYVLNKTISTTPTPNQGFPIMKYVNNNILNSVGKSIGFILFNNLVYTKNLTGVWYYYSDDDHKWTTLSDQNLINILNNSKLNDSVSVINPTIKGKKQVKEDIVNNYSYIAGDLNNPYFEEPGKTSYHLGLPGCPALWSNNFKCDELSYEIVNKNSNISWGPNPQFCSIVTKKIYQNGVDQDKWVTDFIYTTYFAFNGSTTIIPGLGTHQMDTVTVIARFLTEDLVDPTVANPIRFYLASKDKGTWYLPKDMMFRRLANFSDNRNIHDKTHPIIYLARESHEPYIQITQNNETQLFNLVNDNIEGGVCWQPPALFVDNPQDSDAYNTKIKLFGNATISNAEIFYNSFLSKSTTYTDIKTFFSDFISLDIRSKNDNSSSKIDLISYLSSNFFGFGLPWLYYLGKHGPNTNEGNHIFHLKNFRVNEGSCVGNPLNKNYCAYLAGQQKIPYITYVSPLTAKPIMDNEKWNPTSKWFEPVKVICNTGIYKDYTGNSNSCVDEFTIKKLPSVYAITDVKTITQNLWYTNQTTLKKDGWVIIPTSNFNSKSNTCNTTYPGFFDDTFKLYQNTNKSFLKTSSNVIYIMVRYQLLSLETNKDTPVLTSIVVEDVGEPNYTKKKDRVKKEEPNLNIIKPYGGFSGENLLSGHYDSTKKKYDKKPSCYMIGGYVYYTPLKFANKIIGPITFTNSKNTQGVILGAINSYGPILDNTTSLTEQDLTNYKGTVKNGKLYSNITLDTNAGLDLNEGCKIGESLYIIYGFVDLIYEDPNPTNIFSVLNTYLVDNSDGSSFSSYGEGTSTLKFDNSCGDNGQGKVKFCNVNKQCLSREGAYIYAITDVQTIKDDIWYSNKSALRSVGWVICGLDKGSTPNSDDAAFDLNHKIGGHDIYLMVKYEKVNIYSNTPVLTNITTPEFSKKDNPTCPANVIISYNGGDNNLLAGHGGTWGSCDYIGGCAYYSYINTTNKIIASIIVTDGYNTNFVTNINGNTIYLKNSTNVDLHQGCKYIGKSSGTYYLAYGLMDINRNNKNICVDPTKNTADFLLSKIYNNLDRQTNTLIESLLSQFGNYNKITKRLNIEYDTKSSVISTISIKAYPHTSYTNYPPIYLKYSRNIVDNTSFTTTLYIGKIIANTSLNFLGINSKITLILSEFSLPIKFIIKLPGQISAQDYVPDISNMLPPAILKIFKDILPTENNVYNNFYRNNTYNDKFSPWNVSVNDRKNYVDKNLGYGTNPESLLTISEFNTNEIITIDNLDGVLSSIKTILQTNFKLYLSDDIVNGVKVGKISALPPKPGSDTLGVSETDKIRNYLNDFFTKFNINAVKWKPLVKKFIADFKTNNTIPDTSSIVDILMLIIRYYINVDNINVQNIKKIIE